MRNIILYFAISMMVACAHKPSFFNKYKDRQIYSRKYPVKTESEARKLIENRMAFLRRIYQPSLDPVAETPLITPECIKETRIGSVIENNKMIMSASTLYVDNYGNVGLCATDFRTKRINSVYLYCKRDNYVLILNFSYEPDFEDKINELEFCAL